MSEIIFSLLQAGTVVGVLLNLCMSPRAYENVFVVLHEVFDKRSVKALIIHPESFFNLLFILFFFLLLCFYSQCLYET